MPIKWKKLSSLKPELILEKIHAYKKIENGRVSYVGFNYFKDIAAILNMLEFPEYLSFWKKRHILAQAISNVCLRAKKLDKDNVLGEMKRLLNEHTAQKEQIFYLLTSISIKPSTMPRRRVQINDATIEFLNGDYPDKFSSRNNINISLQDAKHNVSLIQSGYTNVLVKVSALDADSAFEKAMQRLNILRGVMCLYANYVSESYTGHWEPINKIRLGGFHTVHTADGKNYSDDRYWFEPIYNAAKPIILALDRQKELKKFIYLIIEGLKISNFKEIIEDAIVRYVGALDEKDPNVAFILAWGALEALLSHGSANNASLPYRCATIFKDTQYHEQILEHLKLYRNETIHAGVRNEDVKDYCYLVQYYFEEILYFLLHKEINSYFQTIGDVYKFLELPRGYDELQKKYGDLLKNIGFVEKAMEILIPIDNTGLVERTKK